jgi:hypothetical protein
MKDRLSRRGAETAEKKADKVFYSEIAFFPSVISASLAKRAREKRPLSLTEQNHKQLV